MMHTVIFRFFFYFSA
ncbi:MULTISPECIES: pheST operon leader peptide PheM [Yersinia pseudotuberculosis complex]|nr:pheST operon leader peptide PheM [Yersinia pestis]MBF4412068.1 pheST operon leader peptide PheM [Yersinia pestis subsp. pestis]MBK1425112.1 pheST operon leader peptide PheM [Yersinia pseudotuberculosis]QQD42567.1 pheST operon leader peptide PheM [Yersinia pestis EV NIIEG]MBD3446973.1 pheST operon leader peptide PheM [Yersinia pestis]